MKFSYYDLGNRQKGEIVEVSLSNVANVRLMDYGNYRNYKNGRRHHFYGGLAKKSPIRIAIPRSGHWYVTIDLGGYSGKVNHSLQVLPGLLPDLKRQIPLVQEPNFFVDSVDSGKDYDVFISHASEDKAEVVRPLAIALENSGVHTWYDEFELKIGDSLRRKIDQGLARSRFGIVVISRSFIKKGWTNYELDGLITRAVSGQQVILPIWHDVTKQEVIDYSPSIADKVARNTSQQTIEEIAIEIADLIKSN